MIKNRIYLRLIKRLDELIMFICIIVILILVVMQILSRFISLLPAHWFEEIIRLLFGYMVFFGMSAAIKSGEHVKISFLFYKLSEKGQKLLEIIGLLVSISFLILLSFYLINMIIYYQSKKMVTASLQIPIYIVRTPFVIACIIAIVRYCNQLVKVITNKKYKYKSISKE